MIWLVEVWIGSRWKVLSGVGKFTRKMGREHLKFLQSYAPKQKFRLRAYVRRGK